MKARLSTLLADLGELPKGLDRAGMCKAGLGSEAPDMSLEGSYARATKAHARLAFARVLDDVCPAGSVSLHNKRIPGSCVGLEHLVVAPRGLVVVSPEWAPARPAARAKSSVVSRGSVISERAAGAIRQRRSVVVRDALHRAIALRAWLAATAWAGTPVLTAVCYAPAVPVAGPPVLIDGVWLGAIERLGPWLGSGAKLTAPERGALAYFLATELD